MGGLSLIVPTLNEAGRVGPLVAEALAQGFAEAIVVDGGSQDATCAEAAAAGAQVLRSAPGRGRQLHAGAEAARGAGLVFIHADSRLPPAAAADIAAALAAPRVVAGAFRLQFDHPAWPLALFAGLSALNLSLATYGDQGLFVRREAYQRVGGFRPLPLFEDLDIQRRLRRAGRFVKLKGPIVTSARRFEADGIWRRQAGNAALVLAYGFGVSPERLARWYRPHRAGAARPSALAAPQDRP